MSTTTSTDVTNAEMKEKVDKVEDISMLPIEYDENIESTNMKIKATREERKYASHTPRTKVQIIVEEAGETYIDTIMLKSTIKPKTFKKFMNLNERLQQNIESDEETSELETDEETNAKIVMEKDDFFYIFEMLFDILEPIIDENGTSVPIEKEWFDQMDWEIKTSLLEVVMKYFDKVIDENEKK